MLRNHQAARKLIAEPLLNRIGHGRRRLSHRNHKHAPDAIQSKPRASRTQLSFCSDEMTFDSVACIRRS